MSTSAKPLVVLRNRRTRRYGAHRCSELLSRTPDSLGANGANARLLVCGMRTLARMLDATLDHVAIAVRSFAAALPFVVDALGGSFLFAGEQPAQGFRWAQFQLAGGGKLELVTPIDAESFLARFLEDRGEGVHHVTLKVPDVTTAIAHLQSQGVPLTGVSLENPGWKEAFIHPREAHGTLVQLAQSPWSDEDTARHHLADHAGADHRHLTLEDLKAETGYIRREVPGA